MAAYRAVAPVFDSETGRTYMPGRTFEMDDARADELVAASAASRLPGACPAEADGGTETDGMTRDQLVRAAAERGIEVPSKATKAEITALLAGED